MRSWDHRGCCDETVTARGLDAPSDDAAGGGGGGGTVAACCALVCLAADQQTVVWEVHGQRPGQHLKHQPGVEKRVWVTPVCRTNRGVRLSLLLT